MSEGIQGALTSEIGGIPGWVWAGVVGGAVFVGYVLPRIRGGSTGQASGDGTTDGQAPYVVYYPPTNPEGPTAGGDTPGSSQPPSGPKPPTTPPPITYPPGVMDPLPPIGPKPPSVPKPPTSSVGTTHTVRAGETLWGIAQKYYGSGSKYMTIYEANRAVIGPNPSLIRPGQVLRIP